MIFPVEFRQFLKTKFYLLFLYQRRLIDSMRLRASVRRKIRTFPQFVNAQKDKMYIKESRFFLEDNFSGYKNTDYHFYYSTLNNIKSIQYIPNDLYFNKIEPTLNDYALLDAYSDKISFDLFFDKTDLPETVYKVINYKFYDNENNLINHSAAIHKLLLMDEKLVLKPAIMSGGGIGVVIDSARKISKILSSDHKYLKGSYILQKYVTQHPQLAKFHPSSLNTCRVMTARVGSNIVVLSSYLRIGRSDSKIDNAQSGGIMCKIDNNGSLSDYAIDVKANRFCIHPDSGVIFKGNSIPNFEKVIAFCLSKHKQFLRFTFISWDIGIKEDGYPVFIEFNLSRQSINAHQIFMGSLFGEYTGELLKIYNEERNKGPNNI